MLLQYLINSLLNMITKLYSYSNPSMQQQIKKYFTKFDIFSTLPTLRAEGESQVVNLCGSIFSIILFSFFVYIFINSIVSIINLEQISASQIVQRSRTSQSRIQNITLAVGLHKINRLNLTALRHIFEVRAFTSDRNLRSSQINVFPCQRQFFDMIDETNYQTLDLSTHLCIQRDQVNIYGEFGSPQVQFIFFNLSICSNATSPVPCASSIDITNFFNTQMFWGRFMVCSVIIIDTGLNPTKQNPLTFSAYQKTSFLLFNLKQQTFVQTFIGTYQINSDISFLPFNEQSQIKGYYVQQCSVTTIVNYLNIPVFIQAYFFPSPVHRKIDRVYGKFDEVLSYVGGLYGIVVSFFAFFLLAFNQYKYQLRVSQGAFSFKDGHLARQSDLNFPKYLKYTFYTWLKTLTCQQPNWPDCKAIDQARQQANQQIDVKHLLQRISHLEKVIKTFINPQGQKFMYMAQTNTLEEARSCRRVIEYCNKFRNLVQSPTISTLESFLATNFEDINNLKTQQSIVHPISSNHFSYHPNNTSNNNNPSNLPNFQQHKQQSSSLTIMQTNLRKYIQKYNINQQTFELSEQDLKAQKQLYECFYKLDQSYRVKLIKYIPLGILYRISLLRNISIQKIQDKTVLEIIEQDGNGGLDDKILANPNPIIQQMQMQMQIKRNARKKRYRKDNIGELESLDNMLEVNN